MLLRGGELQTQWIKLNGKNLDSHEYEISKNTLSLKKVPQKATFENEVRIYPQNNTSLLGLYKSDGLFVTQCEAEGFKNITWHPDRPDVLSKFHVTIDASLELYPNLLSNGNLIAQEKLDDKTHRAVWGTS